MIALAILTAAILGSLAFFEPCAIATHAVFSVRTHNQPQSSRYRNLLLVWLSRSMLLIGLLVLAVTFISPVGQAGYIPSLALSAMAIVYVVSRFIYLPIPHLAFYKLLPGSRNISHALQLGLTLPACAIPLFLVVAGVVVVSGSTTLAILAGAVFATFFTLPMFVASITGLHEDGRELLNRAATGSPFLAAALLFGGALYLLVPALGVDTGSFEKALTHASLFGIVLGFLAGFVFSFNPVSFASVPVVLAYVTKAHEERRAVSLALAFVAGMIVTHVALGVAAALGGSWVQGTIGRQWGAVLGPVLIVLGLMWPGWLKVRLPWFGMRGRKVTGFWGAFVLGIPFSIAVCPFCTPALIVALTASAAIGSPGFGFGLLLAFAIGRSIPILLGAWSVGWLESLKMLSRHQKVFETIAGITLILSGLYLLNEYYFFVDLGGM